MIELIKELNSKYKFKVHFICCHDAQENLLSEKDVHKKGLGLFFNSIHLELFNKMEAMNRNL